MRAQSPIPDPAKFVDDYLSAALDAGYVSETDPHELRDKLEHYITGAASMLEHYTDEDTMLHWRMTAHRRLSKLCLALRQP